MGDAARTAARAQSHQARLAHVLKATPLIDGRIGWAQALRERQGEGYRTVDLPDQEQVEEALEQIDSSLAVLRTGGCSGRNAC